MAFQKQAAKIQKKQLVVFDLLIQQETKKGDPEAAFG